MTVQTRVGESSAPVEQAPHAARNRPVRLSRVMLYAFLSLVCVGWLAPLLLAVYASLRPYQETVKYGYFSLPRSLTLDYYGQAWTEADLPKYYLNTLIVVVPGVVVTLLLASFTAFAIARLRIPGRQVLLIVFTAGNLLPPQVLIPPLYSLYIKIPMPEWISSSQSLYDSYLGLILIHVAFQFGFCVFVLANFMRKIPEEISEAARVDGAGNVTLAALLAAHAPPVPPGAGRARHTGVHLDVQRLPVGAGADVVRRQAAGHLGAEQSARPVLHRLQPALGRVDPGGRRPGVGAFRQRRRLPAGGAAHPHHFPTAAQAVHLRPHPRSHQRVDRDGSRSL